MEYVINQQDSTRRIVMSGQFTFSDNQKFKQVLALLDDSQMKALVVDFTEVDFIDSAGLGMLLLLRDECQARNIAISIAAAKGQVEKIFLISKFDQLFSMVS
ncbi:MAG: anti-sigma factor antagonist [Proteobacteria bacterium]|nr:anti-sigma factor antagonist [Pseudomonadota bacterium]